MEFNIGDIFYSEISNVHRIITDVDETHIFSRIYPLRPSGVSTEHSIIGALSCFKSGLWRMVSPVDAEPVESELLGVI